MARKTIAQLTEENAQLYQQAEELNSEIVALRELAQQLRSLNEAQAAKLETARKVWHEQNDEIKRLSAQPARIARPDNSAILARMQAAREQAMKTGKTVKV